MKMKICKCLIALGMFVLFVSLVPPNFANATTVETVKENDYKLNIQSTTLVKGSTYALKVYNLNEGAKVLYKSDDEEVASVSETGVITANKVGTTTIKATVKDGINITNLTCEVTVGLPAFSVKISRSKIIVGLDKSDLLNVILKPSNTVESARFSSYDSSIVSVSVGGRITAKKIGLSYVFAEIEATNADGTRKYSACTVIVVKPEDVSALETYFNDHPELDYADQAELSKAYYEFFNSKYDPASTTSLTNSFNSYLDDKFGLAKLKEARDKDLAKIQSNSLEVSSGN